MKKKICFGKFLQILKTLMIKIIKNNFLKKKTKVMRQHIQALKNRFKKVNRMK